MRGFTLLSLAVLLAGCNSATTTQTVPSISFSTQINITNQQYRALRFDNGVVALPATGINGGGVKGLLVAGCEYLPSLRTQLPLPALRCVLFSKPRPQFAAIFPR
jgi:hypothetical protein